MRGAVEVLDGEYQALPPAAPPLPRGPAVVFAGRHIPEKRVPALVRAFAALHERAPELRLEVYGDGPERARVLKLIASLGLGDVARAPGFVDAAELEDALAPRALHGAAVAPRGLRARRRRGGGARRAERRRRGRPTTRPPSSSTRARTGSSPPSASPEDLAAAILRVRDAGPALRASHRGVVRAQRRAAVAVGVA